MSELAATEKLSKKDFESGQDVRWCPGCGDYSILATMQRFLPSLNIPIEKYVFVSGIGCSSRFPYYMNTYGFHTIHGRAPAVATGLKLANPDLSVWLVTGDGDSLSIGGNHIIHILRRNPNIKILLFNNRIYGLTKGQYSPTSEQGKVTGSTPFGSVDHPLNPLLVALGAEATFVARSLDVDAKHLTEILRQAHEHQGTAFIEIYQNCNIFNDGAFDHLSDRSKKEDTQLPVIDGELLIFGKEKNKGIKLNGLKPEIVEFASGDLSSAIAAGVARYDASDANFATLLARLNYPEFPVPFGVLYKKDKPVLESLVHKQITDARRKNPTNPNTNIALRALYESADTWTVK